MIGAAGKLREILFAESAEKKLVSVGKFCSI